MSNAASMIAPQTNCVACHDDGVIDLNAIPNQFIKTRAYGVKDKMTHNFFPSSDDPEWQDQYECIRLNYSLPGG